MGHGAGPTGEHGAGVHGAGMHGAAEGLVDGKEILLNDAPYGGELQPCDECQVLSPCGKCRKEKGSGIMQSLWDSSTRPHLLRFDAVSAITNIGKISKSACTRTDTACFFIDLKRIDHKRCTDISGEDLTGSKGKGLETR